MYPIGVDGYFNLYKRTELAHEPPDIRISTRQLYCRRAFFVACTAPSNGESIVDFRWTDHLHCPGYFRIHSYRFSWLLTIKNGLLCFTQQPVHLYWQRLYTTTLIILPFTIITFLGALPSSHFCTTSLASTSFSISGTGASSGNPISERVLPLMATG